ncbi:hypothetical protein [Gimesia algae]|uniref:Uncharacterized protein n=1 Tax=Gimesia algae TaxID=2527971 RepID=A0A517VFG1_9PLAN|nr:hypothetical protein [Gimesia algae]QDT91729.1 hypothetical protein Pan161_33920 [Gimesia algae]
MNQFKTTSKYVLAIFMIFAETMHFLAYMVTSLTAVRFLLWTIGELQGVTGNNWCIKLKNF